MTLGLRYLSFDHHEDAHGSVNFDAMASVQPGQLSEVRAEVQQVLDWANQHFPGAQAPLDDGGEWDFDLQSTEEADGISQEAGATRWTITLSITGTSQFAQAFAQHFSWD